MQALGISLQEGLSRFMELGDEFFDLLTDPDSGTNISNITTFIEAFSDNGWSAETQSIGLTEANLSIQQANNVLALVTIDTDPDMNGGVIGSGNTSHWVHIGAISDGLVTYYNPYTNVEETVNAETFEEAWESTPGNEGSFISVLAMN